MTATSARLRCGAVTSAAQATRPRPTARRHAGLREVPTAWVAAVRCALTAPPVVAGARSLSPRRRWEIQCQHLRLSWGGGASAQSPPPSRPRWPGRRASAVDSVLVTCDEDNVASAKVTERCGGEFEGSSMIRSKEFASVDTGSTEGSPYWDNRARSCDFVPRPLELA